MICAQCVLCVRTAPTRRSTLLMKESSVSMTLPYFSWPLSAFRQLRVSTHLREGTHSYADCNASGSSS
jgi:hypothetical protein